MSSVVVSFLPKKLYVEIEIRSNSVNLYGTPCVITLIPYLTPFKNIRHAQGLLSF